MGRSGTVLVLRCRSTTHFLAKPTQRIQRNDEDGSSQRAQERPAKQRKRDNQQRFSESFGHATLVNPSGHNLRASVQIDPKESHGCKPQ